MNDSVNASEGLKLLLKALETRSAQAADKLPSEAKSSPARVNFDASGELNGSELMEQNVPAVNAGGGSSSSPPFYLPEIYNAEKDIGLRADTGAQRFKRLKPVHKQVIALHLAGWPNNAIAAHVGKNAAYVSVIINDPLAQEVIKNMEDLHEQEFSRLRVLANEALREALGPEKPSSIRLKAASIFYKRDAERSIDKGETAEDVMAKVLQKIEAENVQINIHNTYNSPAPVTANNQVTANPDLTEEL